jgi:hypothetical protein
MTTNAWVIHAGSHDLPREEIPKLQTGESGETYGWPSGLLGPQSSQRLHDMGITTTSLLLRVAGEFNAEQWKKVFGGKREDCERSVWPTRYAGVQEYLQHARKVHAVEYERRRRAALQAPDSNAAAGRTTNAWAVFADTFKLPLEDIPKTLNNGETGGHYGWPSGMMGKEACDRLHAKGITRCSDLIEMALSMDHDQFHKHFGGTGNVFPGRYAGAHLYLIRCVTSNPENAADYRSRLAKRPQQGFLAAVRAWCRKNSIPEGVFFTAILFLASILAAVLANNAVFSPAASFVTIIIGLRIFTGQSFGRCFCLAAYAFLAEWLAALAISPAFGYLAFGVCVFVSVDHFDKIPPFLIPASLR